jgi:uncharacterized protein (DUF58 family)
MPLASSLSSYPLLNIFWTMLEFFVWVLWIWTVIAVFMDIFRSADLSGLAKAVWFVLVLLIPFFGVLVYLIVRGSTMHERSARQLRNEEKADRAYAQASAPDSPGTTADQLSKLAALRDQGHISPAEFDSEKAKVLA